MLDLGSRTQVASVTVTVVGRGHRPPGPPRRRPGAAARRLHEGGAARRRDGRDGADASTKPTAGRYVLLWLTKLPAGRRRLPRPAQRGHRPRHLHHALDPRRNRTNVSYAETLDTPTQGWSRRLDVTHGSADTALRRGVAGGARRRRRRRVRRGRAPAPRPALGRGAAHARRSRGSRRRPAGRARLGAARHGATARTARPDRSAAGRRSAASPP